MLKAISAVLIAAALVTATFALVSPGVANAASCTNSLNTCAARCRKDVPDDRNCVSDHCAPKFGTCKATGCWQEGARYGNVKTCNLTRQ